MAFAGSIRCPLRLYAGEDGREVNAPLAAKARQSGRDCELVVVKGDPSQKIEDIENVEIVFKDGVGYDSAKLIESVRGMVGSR